MNDAGPVPLSQHWANAGGHFGAGSLFQNNNP
jgi:hypothetical protein